MANASYQPTWVGALPANQTQPAPQMMQSPPTMGQPVVSDNGAGQPQTITNQVPVVQPQWVAPQVGAPMTPWGMVPMSDGQLFIANVQSDEAVNNYPVGRGVTAFLVNYNAGVFWTKRQTDDGLGYKTVKHYFYTDEQTTPAKNQNGISGVSVEEFTKLKDELKGLRRDFDEFIK